MSDHQQTEGSRMWGSVTVGTAGAVLAHREDRLLLRDLHVLFVRPKAVKAGNCSNQTDVYFSVHVVHSILILHIL